ncbi:hypothetical protein Tco_1191078, partial [Tanacetum coccineum]
WVGDGGDKGEGGGCGVVKVAERGGSGVEARDGEWIWGSGRSDGGKHLWTRPEKLVGKWRPAAATSPENFSGGRKRWRR